MKDYDILFIWFLILLELWLHCKKWSWGVEDDSIILQKGHLCLVAKLILPEVNKNERILILLGNYVHCIYWHVYDEFPIQCFSMSFRSSYSFSWWIYVMFLKWKTSYMMNIFIWNVLVVKIYRYRSKYYVDVWWDACELCSNVVC